MNKYLLGIDNGGTDIKCAIFDLSGNEVAASNRHVPLNTPGPGYTERDAEEVWSANVKVIQEALSKSCISGEDIIGVGVTAYGNGLVFVDENIHAVYPAIVSTDDRAGDLCAEFKNNGTERAVFPYTRQTLWSAQPAVLLPWFKQNKPEVLEKTRWILSMKDYIRYRMTGNVNGELTEASSTSLMNQNTKSYEPAIFDILGISDCIDKMPKVLNCTDIAGYVTDEAAEITGLKKGTPVAAGYFDIDANALASGILSDDELCLIAGTWSINEYLTKDAADNYDERTNTATHSYLDGYYIMEDSTPTSASNFNWYIQNIIKKYSPNTESGKIYDTCNKLVSERDPRDSSVIFVPYIYGSATHPDAHGAFMNITGRDDDVSMLRAIYEGVVFSSIHHVHCLKRPVNTYKKAKLSGGVANSEVWSQMMADALQIPIQTLEGTQIGAKGAVMGAGVACGVFKDLKDAVEHMVHIGKTYEPRPEYADIYALKFERYESALEALDNLAEKL